MRSPFKAYYVTRMYRYGRPQAGRYREHRQFGIEVFDEASPAADVETIVVGDRFLRELGLSRYRVDVNSIGDEACRPAYREELLTYLRANRDRLRDEHRDRFEDNPLRVLDCKDQECAAVAADAPRLLDRLCEDCRTHFDEVLEGLRAEGLEPVITPTLVRGLDYYTRTAFEFASEVLSQAQATLFGGGRYDGLAEALGGPRVPGVGFGMGLERVLLALADEGVEPPGEAGPVVFVAGIGSGREAATALLRTLRGAGVPADALFEERSLKAQLKAADRADARFAAIVGDRDAEAGVATLRRLSDGAQEEVRLDDVVNWLARADGASER
jgi:histidyl-tRNA synthetase